MSSALEGRKTSPLRDSSGDGFGGLGATAMDAVYAPLRDATPVDGVGVRSEDGGPTDATPTDAVEGRRGREA